MQHARFPRKEWKEIFLQLLKDRSIICGEDEFKKQLGYILRNVKIPVEELIAKYLLGEYMPYQFQAIENSLLDHIIIMEERASLLTRILNEDLEPLSFDEDEQNLIDNPVPMVFVYDKEKHMRIIDDRTQEYRTTAPLSIGTDISSIATDTIKNAQRLQSYFAKHNIDITIIRFADLVVARENLIHKKEIANKTIKPETLLPSKGFFTPTNVHGDTSEQGKEASSTQQGIDNTPAQEELEDYTQYSQLQQSQLT